MDCIDANSFTVIDYKAKILKLPSKVSISEQFDNSVTKCTLYTNIIMKRISCYTVLLLTSGHTVREDIYRVLSGITKMRMGSLIVHPVPLKVFALCHIRKFFLYPPRDKLFFASKMFIPIMLICDRVHCYK